MSSRTLVMQNLGLYVVTDPDLSSGRSHEEVASQALAGGADVIQLRDKRAPARDLYDMAHRIKKICDEAGALFIVNDRVDVALAVGAGVHLGQDDLPARVARVVLGPKAIMGVSVENVEQAVKATEDGADYVAVGPIYEARGSKSDAGDPVGPAAVTLLRRHTPLPIVAIGGINHDHIGEVIGSGAHGVAVMSAIVGAEDIVGAALDMKRLLEQARS